MPWDRYRRVLANHSVRQALVLGFLVRMPIFTGGVVLTLHVVSSLGRSYAAAGLVAAAATIAIAVSGPWRGRLLDRVGLRRVVVPSIVVAAGCWSVAPFVPYAPLLGLAALAGLFAIPSFSIIRQVMISAVPESDRRTAISLDGVSVELSFMVGPAAGVWAATVWPTSWVLFWTEMGGVAAGALLWAVNPALHSPDHATAEREGQVAAQIARSEWFRTRFLAVCGMAAATTIVLGGSDIAIVAALREFGRQGSIGLVLALWGLGSVIGGLAYGALHRPISAYWLLGALGVVTVPMALAGSVLSLAGLAFVAGLLCAPTITATVDQASRVVPEAARGEAMGWHGSSMTAGMAVGAPLAGAAIDRWSFAGGFVLVGVIGLVVALVAVAAASGRRRGWRAQTTEPVHFSPGP